jgi:uncharacterized protein
MRSISFEIVIGFLLIYSLLSILVYKNISVLTALKRRLGRFLRTAYIASTILVALFFILLFVYPGNTRQAGTYMYYFLFNVVLTADILCKMVMAVCSLPYWIMRLFRFKVREFLMAGIILSTGILLSIFFGAFIGRNQLRVVTKEISFRELPVSFDGLRVVHLSDIHLGSIYTPGLLERTVTKVNELSPDLLVFTGDLVNNFSYETKGWEPLFSAFRAGMGKYAILGNHDYGDYSEWQNNDLKAANFQEVTEAYAQFGFRLLRNESADIVKGVDTLRLVGVENWGHPPFPQYADLKKALQKVPEQRFAILMTHDPAHWNSPDVTKEKIELTLSGHTHGLQWGIKPAGIEFSLMALINKYWGGLYERNGSFLYVNRGIGTIGLVFRLDMAAEITLLTLRRK